MNGIFALSIYFAARGVVFAGMAASSSGCRSSRPKWWLSVVSVGIAFVACVSSALASTATFETAKAATCKLSGCSGVHIGSGIVLTAEHCGEQSQATFGTTHHRLAVTHEPTKNGIDEPKRLKADPIPTAAVQIGSPPQVGDQVFALGFPSERLGRQQFDMYSGKVTALPTTTEPYIRTDMAMHHGSSGGPLFNSQWQVIGLTHGSDSNKRDVLTEFIPVEPQRYTRKPKLYIFGKADCIPCGKFKREAWSNEPFKSRLSQQYDVEFVDMATPDGERKAVEYQVTAIPAFIEVAGTAVKIIHIGFTTLRALHVAIWGDPDQPKPQVASQPTNSPEQQLQPTPLEPTPIEPDWSHVKLVLLLPKVGGIRDKLRSVGTRLAEGPIRRAIHSATGGKAGFAIVKQDPSDEGIDGKYEAVASASGHHDLVLLVLVKRQSLGLKGLIVSRVEKSIPDKLKSIPIEVIFERAHPDDFAAIEHALTLDAGDMHDLLVQSHSDEEAINSKPETSWFHGLFRSMFGAAGSLTGGLACYAFGARNKAKAAISQITET